MENLESVQREISALGMALIERIQKMPLVCLVLAPRSSNEDELLIEISIDPAGGEEWEVEKPWNAPSCVLTLMVIGFGRQYCEVRLKARGNVLHHDVARAVVNYVTNMLHWNGYKEKKVQCDSGSCYDGTWQRPNEGAVDLPLVVQEG